MTEKQIQTIIEKNMPLIEGEDKSSNVPYELNYGVINIRYKICLN
jgi:hypothetical protein